MEHDLIRERLAGAFPALITPLTATGELDHAGLASLVRWMNGQPLAGYLFLGSTGEQVHLSEFERALVLEVARRHVPADRLLLAGTGLAGTRTTISETRRAAEAGADVALVVTPSYYQKAMGAEALLDHYQAVAEGSPIPILLYSVPGVTGVTLPASVVAAMARHPNVFGMKNSSGEAQLAAAYRLAAPAPFRILAGSPYAAAGALMAGLADGVILAAANLLPEAAGTLVAAAQRGEYAAAQAEGWRLTHATEEVGRYGIAGWKGANEARGLPGGPVRSPLRPLSEGARAAIGEAVAQLCPAEAAPPA